MKKEKKDLACKDATRCKRASKNQSSWIGSGMPLQSGEDSSPGLKIVVPLGLVVAYIQLFCHPGHHHFFIIFPRPFYIDLGFHFGIQLDPKIGPKSNQKLFLNIRSYIAGFQDFVGCLKRFTRFVVLAPLQKFPKSIQIQETLAKVHTTLKELS